MTSVRKKRRRRKQPYSKGALNRMIDDVLHPLYKINGGFVLVDGVLHGMVESDPPQSVVKFIRYNLPKILEQMGK